MSPGPLRLVPSGRAPDGASVLYWCDTTAGQDIETGVQRVTRRLAAALARGGRQPVAVGWDPERRLVIDLATRAPVMGTAAGPGAGASWLVVPEIPLSVLADDVDPVQLGHALGLRVAAIVHDLIPVRFARDYPDAVVATYRRYYRMFASADRVLATTALVAGHLRAHLAAEALTVPGIAVIPLPAQLADLSRRVEAPPPRAAGEPLRLLAVVSWEPRKNLLGLLAAVRRAEARGVAVRLTLVGGGGLVPGHDAVVEAALADTPGAQALGRIDDAALAELYARHDAGVYPSLEEGFGLPVLESLWMGRPCLCHAGSAMAEVAPGGGTLSIDMSDVAAFAEGLMRLATEPGLLERLGAEARTRDLRGWDAYAADVADALEAP